MIEDTPECRVLFSKIQVMILRLSMVSHGPSQSFNPAPPPDDLKRARRLRLKITDPTVPYMGARDRQSGGSKIPGLNLVGHDDRQFDYRQKSDAYFATRLARWEKEKLVRGVADLEPLLKEAEEALYDWQHSPVMPGGLDPDKDTFLWRCMIADAPGTVEEVRKKYGLGKRTVERYRAQYRGIRKQAA